MPPNNAPSSAQSSTCSVLLHPPTCFPFDHSNNWTRATFLQCAHLHSGCGFKSCPSFCSMEDIIHWWWQSLKSQFILLNRENRWQWRSAENQSQQLNWATFGVVIKICSQWRVIWNLLKNQFYSLVRFSESYPSSILTFNLRITVYFYYCQSKPRNIMITILIL